MDFRYREREGADCIQLVQDRAYGVGGGRLRL
jgi:hypothetical protein